MDGKHLTKKHVGAGLGVALTLAMAAFVVYRWRTSGFAWREFTASLANVDWTWLALALALILATYVGRAMRWEVMLRPLQKNTSLWRIFSATAIGFTRRRPLWPCWRACPTLSNCKERRCDVL